MLEESLRLCREVGNTWAAGRRLARLALVALARHDLPAAKSLWRESLAVCREAGDQWGIAMSLVGLAGAAGSEREPERAARLLGAVDAIQPGLAAVMWPVELAEYRRTMSATRAALDEARFEAAWDEGQAMTPEEALAYAEETCEPARSGATRTAALLPAAPAEPAGLTPREAEVLRLIAAGKSNQDIAAALTLSTRTVERHVSNIYEKIGVHGNTARAAATAYAFNHGLAQA
jgi:non-specific serine/threonine protein kinase